jgi:hypothetical protein
MIRTAILLRRHSGRVPLATAIGALVGATEGRGKLLRRAQTLLLKQARIQSNSTAGEPGEPSGNREIFEQGLIVPGSGTSGQG